VNAPNTQERAVATAELTYRIWTPDKVHRAVCSPDHATLWLMTNRPLLTDARLLNDPLTVAGSCAHCSWCGTLVAEPPVCRIHDADGCPGFDPLVTEHALRAVRSLKQMYRVDGLTPRGWQYLERAAQQLHDSGSLTARALVARMRDVAIDWAP
jgi:hypothetical protein